MRITGPTPGLIPTPDELFAKRPVPPTARDVDLDQLRQLNPGLYQKLLNEQKIPPVTNAPGGIPGMPGNAGGMQVAGVTKLPRTNPGDYTEGMPGRQIPGSKGWYNEDNPGKYDDEFPDPFGTDLFPRAGIPGNQMGVQIAMGKSGGPVLPNIPKDINKGNVTGVIRGVQSGTRNQIGNPNWGGIQRI